MNSRKIICHIVCYKDPDYVRGAVVLRALRSFSDYEIIELKNRYKGPLRYIEILVKLLSIRFSKNPDIYIVGFRGHEIALLARIVAFGKQMIFDSLVSPTLSLRFESTSRIKRFISKLTFPFEYLVLHCSDQIIVDTETHRQRICNFFSLSSEKFHVVYVGAKVPNSNKTAVNDKNKFTVLFFGSFLPLHGGDIIFEVAEELESFPIHFTFVGKSGSKPKSQHIELIDWLDYSKLTTLIEQSSICLGGPFGNTPQSNCVITGKTYQFLAFGKPTIIGKIEESLGFKDKHNCFYVEQGNRASLKHSILWAFENPLRLIEIGRQGRDLYERKFSDHIITSQLNKALMSEYE